jgi:integral membrane protein
LSSFNALRIVAVAEATSFLALIVASIIKHSDGGEGGVQILGPIHGVLFLAFVGLVLFERISQHWSMKTTLWLLVASVIPFGGYVAEVWLQRHARSLAAQA